MKIVIHDCPGCKTRKTDHPSRLCGHCAQKERRYARNILAQRVAEHGSVFGYASFLILQARENDKMRKGLADARANV